MNKPLQGEVWWVNFDPTVGAEIKKIRTAVVVSLDSIGRLPLRIVVPITEWDEKYIKFPWMVHLLQCQSNGLSKESTADCFQIKSVSTDRFSKRLGSLSRKEIEEISAAIQLCIGAI
jgi:Growth inhibitor